MAHEDLIARYLAGPASLREAVAGMTDDQLNARPVPEKWSTRQVVCHIADFEPVYIDRIKRVLAEDQPPLRGGDPDLFAAHLAYDRRDVRQELNFIEAARRHMGPILRSLSPEQFARTGIHSESGPLSLLALLESVTDHIPHHIDFIEEKRRALGLTSSAAP
ncbi:MAG: DinB family protein [Pirellulales bacterium]